MDLTVAILDANDNPPEFTAAPPMASVAADAPAGTKVAKFEV